MADPAAEAGASGAAAPEGGGKMKLGEFLSHLDEARIIAAIRAAEQRTSGEIRIFVSTREVEDALAHAERRFEKLGMTRTRERNGVLLYFAPRSHCFAVCGDAGIHEKCGPEFWDAVVAEIGGRLRDGRFTEAVTEAVEKVGALLAQHFPRSRDDSDELPNEIAHD